MPKFKPSAQAEQRYRVVMTLWSTRTIRVADVEPVYGASTVVEGFRVTPLDAKPFVIPLSEFMSVRRHPKSPDGVKELMRLIRVNPFDGWIIEGMPEKAMNDTMYRLVNSETGEVSFAPIWRVSLIKVS